MLRQWCERIGLLKYKAPVYVPMPRTRACQLCRQSTYYDIKWDDYTHAPTSSCTIATLEMRTYWLSRSVEELKKAAKS